MLEGNVVGNLDVAILAVIAFVLFFLGLVYHLRQEDKREGYPMEITVGTGKVRHSEGFPPMPKPKLFYRPHDRGVVSAPREREAPVFPDGAKYQAEGYPMTAEDPLGQALGTAAHPDRHDLADLNVLGEPKIVPLSEWDEYHVADGDVDPRGWPIVSNDGVEVGFIKDLWFNRAEFFLRYFEFEIPGEERTRMAPLFFCKVKTKAKVVEAFTLNADDLRRTPITGTVEYITMLEEDRVNAFFAGGRLYSKPKPRSAA